MDRQILKQFASFGNVNQDEVELLLQLAKERQQSVPNNPASSHIAGIQSNHTQAKKDQPNLTANFSEKLAKMHSQVPFILPPQLSSQLSLPNGFSVPPNGNGPVKDSHNPQELRCFFCGVNCLNLLELNQHIIKEHIPKSLEQDRKRASSDDDRRLSDVNNMFHAKTFSDSSSHSSDADSIIPGSFPIPIPNFSMFNEAMSTPSSSTSGKEGKSADGLSLFGMNLPLNPSLFSLPNAFGLLNPFLSYQNLINGKNTPGSLPGLTANPYGYLPYVGFPPNPAIPPLPARFPYLPGFPLGLPTTAAAVSSSSEKNVKNSSSSGRVDVSQPVVETSNSGNGTTLDSTSESLQRRLSVPMMPNNNEFRVPPPYTRIRKPSHNSHSHEEKADTQPEVAPDQQFRPAPISSKKRPSVNDNNSSNHLNAKSIEQHISKLISNNEKLLTNPELERVKPRRVFRRNSLDPASLSSYATGMSKYNSREMAYYREAAKKPRRMLSENDNSHVQPSDSKSIDGHEGHPSMLSLAEYNEMIQLTRAPFSVSEEQYSRVAGKLAEQFSQASEMGLPKPHNHFPTKRDFPQGYSHNTTKKARRSSFFECNDCGVRYRKEENYKIHKKIYCKFKKGNSLFNDKLRRHSDLTEGLVPTSLANLNLPLDHSSHRKLPHLELTRPGTSRSMALSTVMDRPAGPPLKNTRPDLCRTKSAEASLETALVHDNRWKRSAESFSAPLHPVKHASPPVSMPASSLPSAQNSDTSSTSSSGSSSAMPASKLPPNKRHLMRHHIELESDSTPSPQPALSTPQPIPSDKLPTSSSIEPQPTPANEFHCDNKFDESLVPRSNYKLLVHQISLRNLQDIGMMGDLSSNLLQNKSVWSWEQMQNLKHDKMLDLSCETPPHQLLQGIPTSSRKFSVPSRLLTSPMTSTTNNKNTAQSEEITSANLSSLNAIDSSPTFRNSESTHKETSASHSTTSSSHQEGLSRGALSQRISDDGENISTANVDPSSTDLKTPSDANGTTTSCSDENTKLLEAGAAVRREKGVVLYPHVEPALDCNTLASFCCMVSPQPACIVAAKSPEDRKTSQLSMYSEWAASEPFLIPEGLTIADILNGWRQCHAPSRRGVVTCVCAKSELLLTDNKDYEETKSAKTSGNDEKCDPSVSEKPTCHSKATPYKVADLRECKSNFVNTSCHRKHTSHGFPYDMPDFNKTTSSPAPQAAKSPVSPDDVTIEDGRNSMDEDGTSSAPRESDAADASQEFSGRVKKLRTRKDRSSTSPREKRNAILNSVSPTAVMAVHQDGMCCDVTHEKSSSCALCSMKAGKSVPDASTRRDSTGSKSPAPPPAKKFAQIMTIPVTTGAVLDRTRGTSGNTQHWVSDTSQIATEPSKPISFSPVSCGSGTEDAPQNRAPAGEGGACPIDVEKSSGLDRNGTVVNSSLAEVVSEVMRTAAIQSKMHSKRRQLLSGSRALCPRENDDESPASKRRNIRCASQPTQTEESHEFSDSNRALSDSNTYNSSPGEEQCPVTPSKESTVNGKQTSNPVKSDSLPCSEKNEKLYAHCDDTSSSEAHPNQETGSPANDDDDVGVRYDAAKTGSPPRSPGSNIAARPFLCSECKIAFRIGGHLAKHLRSKGHLVAVQKKTLNRLKLSQIQKLSAFLDVEETETPAADQQQPSHKGNGSVSDPEVSEILIGSDVLAHAQLRALLEGSGEYASYPEPPRPSEEVQDNSSPNDPRPYKCIACRVAFRFQGHLDRHFRSNSHLIAVGHYEQVPSGFSSDVSNLSERPLSTGSTEHRSPTISQAHSPTTAIEKLPETHLADQLYSRESSKENHRISVTSSDNRAADVENLLKEKDTWPNVPNGVLFDRSLSSGHSDSSSGHTNSGTELPASPPNPSQLNGKPESPGTMLGHEHIAPKPSFPCQVSCT